MTINYDVVRIGNPRKDSNAERILHQNVKFLKFDIECFLKDLEINNLVSRKVMNTKPITVEYSITEYGKTLTPLIDELAKWGTAYRKSVYGKSKR